MHVRCSVLRWGLCRGHWYHTLYATACVNGKRMLQHAADALYNML